MKVVTVIEWACKTEDETEDPAEKEIISDCSAFFCTCLHGATTAISCWISVLKIRSGNQSLPVIFLVPATWSAVVDSSVLFTLCWLIRLLTFSNHSYWHASWFSPHPQSANWLYNLLAFPSPQQHCLTTLSVPLLLAIKCDAVHLAEERFRMDYTINFLTWSTGLNDPTELLFAFLDEKNVELFTS